MKQALHILKKDVRYLRWELGLSLALLCVFVYAQLARGVLRENRAYIAGDLLAIFWAFLCARLVQAEPIPGDRQFWITRPYQWRSLLGAKLLFMALFIGLPLLAADALILAIARFSIAAHLAGLFWSFLMITAATLMTFVAFATITRGLTEWMLSAIVTGGILYTLASIASASAWGGVEWMRGYTCAAILFVMALVVLLQQYKHRRTVASIIVLGVGLFGASIFVNYSRSSTALALEARFSKPKVDPSTIRIAVRQRTLPELGQSSGWQEVVALAFPIDVSGLGAGQDLISDEVSMDVENDGGQVATRRGRQADLQHRPDGYRVALLLDRSAFEKTRGRPVHVRLTLYLTVLGDSASRIVRLGDQPVDVPGVGRCKDLAQDRDNWIVCESSLRAPSNFLVMNGRHQFLDATSYSPFPASTDSAIFPLNQFVHAGPPDFSPSTLISQEPLAHFRRDLDLPAVYLADYRAP